MKSKHTIYIFVTRTVCMLYCSYCLHLLSSLLLFITSTIFTPTNHPSLRQTNLYKKYDSSLTSACIKNWSSVLRLYVYHIACFKMKMNFSGLPYHHLTQHVERKHNFFTRWSITLLIHRYTFAWPHFKIKLQYGIIKRDILIYPTEVDDPFLYHICFREFYTLTR